VKLEGGCYCGAVRYSAEGEMVFKGQCHCRQCQYITGGSANVIIGMMESGFSYTKGMPKEFKRNDLENPVSRFFCENCGTHIATKPPALKGIVAVKVGTLDDPSVYTGPDMAIWTEEMQNFHLIAEGVPTFKRFPPAPQE
jgi:hypothetical protein